MSHATLRNPSKFLWFRLHLLVEAEQYRPEIALVHFGAIVDVRGYRLDDIPGAVVHQILETYPRLGFKQVFAEALMAQARTTTFSPSARSLKCGRMDAHGLKKRRGQLGNKWHLDEVFLTINGKVHSLWRAVDQDGNVLDILVQSRRNKRAAKKFFRKLLKGLQYVPRVIVTDKLASCAAAKRDQSRYPLGGHIC